MKQSLIQVVDPTGRTYGEEFNPSKLPLNPLTLPSFDSHVSPTERKEAYNIAYGEVSQYSFLNLGTQYNPV